MFLNTAPLILLYRRLKGKQIKTFQTLFFCRSEDDIRAYFATGGKVLPSEDTIINRLPPVDDELFKRWFPGLTLSRTACAAPKVRVLCFTNAGNAEDLYTNEGTGPRRAPSPLLVSYLYFFLFSRAEHMEM